MNRHLLCTALVLVLFTPACKHATPTDPSTNAAPDAAAIQRNSNLIQLSTTEAISLGLSLYGKSQPQLAQMIATKLQEISSTTALAYLDGQSGASSAAVNGFLNAQFVDLPPEVKSIIALAASLLDAYLPAPTATTILSPTQYTYLRAFFQGLTDGSAQFLGGIVPANLKAIQHRHTGKWFSGQ